MGIQVLGHRLLIKPDAVREQKNVDLPSGLKGVGFEVHLPNDLEKREEAGTQVGTVIQVGPTAWRAFDGNDPSWKPWCKAGDRIIFAKYAGKWIEDPETKEKFFVINDEDVQVKLELPRNKALEEALNG
jgi:co-chaperonin GroES (HSP10)